MANITATQENITKILVSDTFSALARAKREARKLVTSAMHGSWQKEFRKLKKKRSNMSDTWYSQQIAKMEIANGRSAETIRKNMKS